MSSGGLHSSCTALLLLLDAAHPEILGNYGGMVQSHETLYDDAWFVVYDADVRMRLPRRPVRGVSDYDPAKPVGDSLRDGIADKEWWNGNVHKPAILNLTRLPQICPSAPLSVHAHLRSLRQQDAAT